VADRHVVATAGVGLLVCWLGLSALGDRHARRANAARGAQAGEIEAVSENLARARRLLPASVGRDRLARFDEVILLGDLIAAVAELEAVGRAADPPPEFWHALVAAAGRMGYDEVRVRLEDRGGGAAPIAGQAEPGSNGA
jgi:hypothetical protein